MTLTKEIKSLTIAFQAFAAIFVLLGWILGENDLLEYTLPVAFAVAFLSIVANLDNLLFFSRTVFIVWIGLVPALALYLGGYFAWRMPNVQTMDVAFILSIITPLALFSSQLGFEAGKKIKVQKKGIDFSGNEQLTLYFIFVLLILSGTLIAMSRGELLFSAGYASDSQQSTRIQMPFQNLQSIVNVLILFALILYFRLESRDKLNRRKRRRLWYLLIFIGFYITVWCQFLRGARMDPLTFIFSFSVLLILLKKKKLNVNAKVIVTLFLAFVVVQTWGGVRHVLYTGNIDVSHLKRIASRLYRGSERNGVPIYFRQGTMNNLSLSVATVIHAIDNGEIDYRYGSTYLDYIARTPPKILYPQRPKSLAWLSSDLYGGGGAGGGFNEMAESYINFGVLGSLIIPGVISFILSYSLRQFMVNRYNILRSLIFISMLAVYFRGLLYQSFTFYKVFVSSVIIYGVILFVHQVFLKPAKRMNPIPCHTLPN